MAAADTAAAPSSTRDRQKESDVSDLLPAVRPRGRHANPDVPVDAPSAASVASVPPAASAAEPASLSEPALLPDPGATPAAEPAPAAESAPPAAPAPATPA